MIEVSISISTVKGELNVHVSGRGACANEVEELYYNSIRVTLEHTIAAVRQKVAEHGMASPGSMQLGAGAVVQHEEFLKKRTGTAEGPVNGHN
jgi:hypothetical protein